MFYGTLLVMQRFVDAAKHKMHIWFVRYQVFQYLEFLQRLSWSLHLYEHASFFETCNRRVWRQFASNIILVQRSLRFLQLFEHLHNVNCLWPGKKRGGRLTTPIQHTRIAFVGFISAALL